jgi:hypothetical protein
MRHIAAQCGLEFRVRGKLEKNAFECCVGAYCKSLCITVLVLETAVKHVK